MEDGAGDDALVFDGAEDARLYCAADDGEGDAHFDGVADGPFAGALLAGFVEDEVHDGLAGLGVFAGEDAGGDFDEEAVEFAFVPVGEDLGEFFGGGVDGGFEDGVGFADELHVAVFDSVVCHFHVVASAVGAHVAAARFAFGDCGDLGVDGGEGGPAFFGAAGHDAGAFERAFFSAGDADAEEVDAFFLEVFFAALGVGPERVAAINDDVAGL